MESKQNFPKYNQFAMLFFMLNKKLIIVVAVIFNLSAFASNMSPKVSAWVPWENFYTTHTSEVKRGQGLYQALKNVSIENESALKVINQLRDEVEFSKLKVGDKLEAKFNQYQELVKFTYSQNPAEKHIVSFNELTQKWEYSFDEAETFWHTRILEGSLKAGSTLQQDLLAQNLSPSVVNQVVQVLLCKVNFRMFARMGDKYQILLSERKFKDELIETKVLYTSYAGVRAGSHEAFFYEDSEKASTYNAHYTESGQALINAGLRYPLPRLHIRSSYGWRRHPVTGRRAMHRGVDLRGRTGDTVRAAAAGKVVISTYNKFAGNKVAIRHRDGSTSYYFHLNKRSVNKGTWVKAHQKIGTVGATGRVTGPHLHFGFKDSRGRWMNPLNKRMIATPKLSGDRLANLKSQISSIKGLLVDLKVSQDARYLVADIPNLREDPVFKFNLLKYDVASENSTL